VLVNGPRIYTRTLGQLIDSVVGSAPHQTLVIEVGLRGGLSQMNEKGEFTLVGDCSP